MKGDAGYQTMLSDEERQSLRRSSQPIRTTGTCMGVTAGYPRVYCLRQGTVDRDGRLYCRQHDPELKRAEAIERRREQAKRQQELEAQWDRRDLERKAGLATLTDDDLRRVIAAGGIKAVIHTLGTPE